MTNYLNKRLKQTCQKTGITHKKFEDWYQVQIFQTCKVVCLDLTG